MKYVELSFSASIAHQKLPAHTFTDNQERHHFLLILRGRHGVKQKKIMTKDCFVITDVQDVKIKAQVSAMDEKIYLS